MQSAHVTRRPFSSVSVRVMKSQPVDTRFLCHIISGCGGLAALPPLLGLMGHRRESVGFAHR